MWGKEERRCTSCDASIAYSQRCQATLALHVAVTWNSHAQRAHIARSGQHTELFGQAFYAAGSVRLHPPHLQPSLLPCLVHKPALDHSRLVVYGALHCPVSVSDCHSCPHTGLPVCRLGGCWRTTFRRPAAGDLLSQAADNVGTRPSRPPRGRERERERDR